MSKTDTHTYDGKIAIELRGLEEASTLSVEEKKERCKLLLDFKINEVAQRFMKQMINDIGTPANYDGTNKLCADDLLVLCAKYDKNEDFLQNLEIQLQDMHTGFCPQGRTHRLYQLLLAFEE